MQKVFIWSVIAALAGFLFGFDTVVISGADQQLQELWGTSDAFHGIVVMGMALWGTVIGAIFGGIPTNRLGRKNTLLWIGILYTIHAIGSAMVNDPITFAAFRFIGGLGVGASTIAAPAYISEIAPAKKRGQLVGLYQFNIVLGILIAFFSNYLLRDTGEQPWRWMLGVEAIPAFIYTMLILFVPKSPRWLISKNRYEEAAEILHKIDAKIDIPTKIKEIKQQYRTTVSKESIFWRKYRLPLILVFFIAFFNQMSGINAILYYSPRIFEAAGLANSTALLSSIGVGLVNLLFTLLGVFLIDKLGRKLLLIVGSIGYIISLSFTAMAFIFDWGGYSVPIFLFLFIASHAIGQGAVIWVFISEVWPDSLRASGQSFGSSTHWVLAAIIPSFIPFLFATIGPGSVFAFFTGMMVLQLLFVIILVPETRGKSLEEIGEELSVKNRRFLNK